MEKQDEPKPKYIPLREQGCETSMLYERIAALKDENERLRNEVRSLRQLLESK